LTQEAEHITIPKTKKKLGWFSKVILWLNWFAIGGLFLSCISPLVSPAVFWPLAFFGLMHPAFVALNFLFLLWWSIRRRRQAFYTLGILVLSIPLYGEQFRFHFGSIEKAPSNSISVMSYNVKLFDLYNWSGNKKTRSRIFTMIAKQKPDLLSLQEFFNQDSGSLRNLDSLKKLLHLPFAHVEYTISLHKDDHWGVVTFSKYPIVNSGKIVFNNRNNNICIYTDVLIGTDTIRIYNMHLQSISFGYADYKFLGQMYNGEDADSELASSENILRRMKRAAVKRARQSESIAQHIATCPYPVIVCGDFNDTPVSYTYRTISSGLEDAFIESGSGFGKSFVNPFPIPRIDFILHSPSMHAFEFSVNKEENLSDHYPVFCKLTLH
jgi:endonuclease/exonuclease/phosphatase family metal-dependent hydrolase